MYYKQEIKIKAPGTIANIVCGFDVLGLALKEPQDEMWLQLIDEPKVIIEHIDAYNLPIAAEQNVAGAALLALMSAYAEKNIGFKLRINKIIKPGSGLGSSAASAAGAVVAANYALGKPFDDIALVGFAMFGEEVASGVKHADNIAPCIYGGVTLVRSYAPLDIIPLSAPDLFISVVHPQIEVKTSDARKILRKEVALKEAICQWGNVAGLVAGFLQKDYGLIGRSLSDVIIEPIRSILIPGFAALKQGCLNLGVLGGGISGSGPSVFMLSEKEETAAAASDFMQSFYNNLEIENYTYNTSLNKSGVKLEF